jgi:hypothetical protein
VNENMTLLKFQSREHSRDLKRQKFSKWFGGGRSPPLAGLWRANSLRRKLAGKSPNHRLPTQLASGRGVPMLVTGSARPEK